MVEEYGITLIQMMENAGRAVARVARTHFFQGDLAGKRVVVLAGTGGNGGGGLVAARMLHNAGAVVHVWMTRSDEAYDGVPAHQLGILRRMGVPIIHGGMPPGPTDLVVDALVGYSLDGPLRGTAADLVRWTLGQISPVLSLDVPSGLDATTGEVFEPHIHAAATVTLALPKTGLAVAAEAVGDLYLADIGVPPAIYSRLGIRTDSIFGVSDIIRL